MKVLAHILVFTLCASAALWPASACAEDADAWQFGASIYGWFPDISGETAFGLSGGNEFKIGIDDILENLEFTLMGVFDARKGRWGVLTDVIYMDVGNAKSGTREGTIGGSPIPTTATADIKLDIESWVWTLTGYYRAITKPGYTMDVIAGTRYLDVVQKIDWSLTGAIGSIDPAYRSGAAKTSLTNWDAIIGARGRYAFGAKKTWFVPYYLDIGVGDSDITYQGIIGLGYAFGWGDIVAVWRYLYYDFASDKAIKDMNFSGPAIGATFRW